MMRRTIVTLFGRDYPIEEARLDGEEIWLHVGEGGPLTGSTISGPADGNRWRLTLPSGKAGAARVTTNRSRLLQGSEVGDKRALVASGEPSRITEDRREAEAQAACGMLLAWSADRD